MWNVFRYNDPYYLLFSFIFHISGVHYFYISDNRVVYDFLKLLNTLKDQGLSHLLKMLIIYLIVGGVVVVTPIESSWPFQKSIQFIHIVFRPL